MDPIVDDNVVELDTDERTVQFKAFYWTFEESNDHEEDNKLVIHIGGRTIDGKTIHCLVEDFPPFVYLELPKRIKWNKAKCMALFEYFKKVLKSDGPISYQLLQKYNLYYMDIMNTMCLSFPTNKAIRLLSNKCKTRTGLVVDGIGTFRSGELIPHLSNIDPIIKFTAAKLIELAGLLTVKETISEDDIGMSVEDRKYSTADIDIKCKWNDVNPYNPPNALSIIVKPHLFFFDIECYSRNHNSKLPDPEDPENVVFSISIVSGKLGEKIETTLLSLYNPKDIKNTNVKRFQTEKDLILYFTQYLRNIDPDGLVGFNIMKFDWNYLIKRSEMLGIYMKFSQISRLAPVGKRAELRKQTWNSSAYGDQEFRYLDPHGRINIDVMIEVERNYKLAKYSLDHVAEFFLGKHKEDVTPRQLFMLFQLTKEMTPLFEPLEDGIIARNKRIELKKKIQSILPRRRCHGEILKIRENLLNSKTGKQFKDYIRDPLTLTGYYNVQDSVLTMEIFEKLNLWTSMESMSNTMNVPMSYLHTRGQQIKVLAQVYRETIFEDIVIPTKEKPKEEDIEKYQGAIVIEANPGDYDNVICFDFESLYPSVMIAYNICYTTLLRDNDPTPDSECNVLEWYDHVGCEHDPQKRKKKAADVLCKHHRYRFRKVVTLPDGTRLNEGVMPKLERKLLSSRKTVKKEMAKYEAILKMAKGTATSDDISYYTKCGWEIVKKDSLDKNEISVLEICIKVLNARQLSLKVSANSAYGGLGAQMGFIPLVAGAASVTAKGRELITEAIKFVLSKYPDAKLVYGDTDSSMITFEGKSTEESFILGDKISKEISHYLKTKLIGIKEEHMILNPEDSINYRIDKFPRKDMHNLSDDDKIKIHEYDANPINLQFENLYKRYLLLTKKRYVATAVNRLGKITANIKKGVVLARRDNCMYLKDTYEPIVHAIREKKSENEVMYILYDQIQKLFTRQIPDANLIKYTAVKNLMSYARREEKKKGRSVVERIFIDKDGEPIKDPTGPLDPRLIYPNLPQVILAIKMMVRGDDVPPNTRLEYIMLENDEARHQGEHAEDYTFYRENKNLPFIDKGTGSIMFASPKGEPDVLSGERHVKCLKPDYLLYIDKQLSKPITELLHVKFPKEYVMYETLEDAFKRCVEELSDLLRFKVKSIKTYEKKGVSPLESQKEVVGWKVLCTSCESSVGGTCAKHMITKKQLSPKVYKYKGVDAQIQYILDSATKKRYYPGVKNEIDQKVYPELIKVCSEWKSRNILNKIHVSFGMPKRPKKKPTQTGPNLPVMTANLFNDAFLTKTVGGFPRGTMVTLKSSQEIVDENFIGYKKKRYKFEYTVEVKGTNVNGKPVVLERVPRSSLTSYRMRDSKIMEDILLYRTQYKYMIKELNMHLTNIKFEGEDFKIPIALLEEDQEDI